MLAVSPATAGGDGAAALAVTTTASTAVAASTAIVANRGNAAGRLLSFEEIDARGLLDGTAATGSFVADLGVEAEMDKEEEEDDDDDDAVIYGELNDDDDDESAVGRSDRVEQVVAKRQDAKCGDDEDEDDEDDEDEVIYGELNDGGGILDADGNVRAPSPPGIEDDAINGCLRPAPAGGCARATALAPHAETTAPSVAATEPVLNGFGRAALGCALGIEGTPYFVLWNRII